MRFLTSGSFLFCIQVTILISGGFLESTVAEAQSLYATNPEHRKRVIRAVDKQVDSALNLLKAFHENSGQLSQSDVDALGKIKLEITKFWIPMKAQAFTKNGRNIVSIDIGHVYFLYLWSQTLMLAAHSGVGDLPEAFLQGMIDFDTGKRNEMFDGFAYVNYDKQQETAFLSSSYHQSYSQFMVANGIWFTYLHEYCHHKLGHVASPLKRINYNSKLTSETSEILRRSRARESKADACAADFVAKAQVAPTLGAATTLVFGLVVDKVLEKNDKWEARTHPFSIDRIKATYPVSKEFLRKANANLDTDFEVAWNKYVRLPNEIIKAAHGVQKAN